MSSDRKAIVGLVLLAVVAGIAWQTMEPGKFRTVVCLLLGFFALRVVLGLRRAR